MSDHIQLYCSHIPLSPKVIWKWCLAFEVALSSGVAHWPPLTCSSRALLCFAIRTKHVLPTFDLTGEVTKGAGDWIAALLSVRSWMCVLLVMVTVRRWMLWGWRAELKRRAVALPSYEVFFFFFQIFLQHHKMLLNSDIIFCCRLVLGQSPALSTGVYGFPYKLSDKICVSFSLSYSRLMAWLSHQLSAAALSVATVMQRGKGKNTHFKLPVNQCSREIKYLRGG